MENAGGICIHTEHPPYSGNKREKRFHFTILRSSLAFYHKLPYLSVKKALNKIDEIEIFL
jgi:hypothetical protein